MAPPRTNPFVRYDIDPGTGCWIWQGASNQGGYGMVAKWTGECVATRLFYKHFNGPLHPDLQVCHRCDNPPCVNPAHLFLGTRSVNQQDCKSKGRDAARVKKGETNNMAVLTEAQVLSIYADSRTQGAIAAEYGVHRTTINLIKTGKKWGWLTAPLGEAHRYPLGNPESWRRRGLA
jgi:hypothetical protein